jgi:hypothetical protein
MGFFRNRVGQKNQGFEMQSEGYGVFGSNPGNLSNEGYAGVAIAPMNNFSGISITPGVRRAPNDYDNMPHQNRNFVNASGAQDMQIHNGLRWGVGRGKRAIQGNSGYLNVIVPQIPGQTRGDAAGFHKRGPSPLNFNMLLQQGPGAQPDNPGGPGKIAAPQFFNPMTG